MHQQLAGVKRAETGRQRVAEVDGTDELVVDGIGDRDGVRELLRRIDPVAMADRYIGIGRCRRRLSCPAISYADETSRNKQGYQNRITFHVRLLFMSHTGDRACGNISEG